MQTGCRFRCYPTRAQAQVLLRWIGCQRFIYNAKVGEDRYFRRFARSALALTGQRVPIDQQYSQFKNSTLTPWLSEVPSVVLRNGAVRWMQGYSRFFQRLGGRPTIHHKHGAQSVWLTRELFRFEAVDQPDADGAVLYRLLIGTRKFPVGDVAYRADRPFRLPAALVVTVDAGRWFVSFNTDDGAAESSAIDIATDLAALPRAELLVATVGVDRGVVIPVCAGPGRHHDLLAVQRRRVERKARSRLRWQRRLARRVKGSGGWRKAKARIAGTHRYGANVRRNFAHQVSHQLVSDARTRLIVIEALKVKNMTRRPRPKRDDRGRWVRNGASAKAGLNKAILDSAWGRIRMYLEYKALRCGKLCLAVPAAYSSQACSCCGYTHPENRPTQARFLCQRCGYEVNADDNAAAVLRLRGVEILCSGGYMPAQHKRVFRGRRNKAGTERPEPAPIGRPRRRRLRQDVQRESAARASRLIPETPTTAARAD